MSKDARAARRGLPGADFFDVAGSDPELLNSGRIPDPAPEHTPLFRWLAAVLTAVEARLRARGNAAWRNIFRVFWALIAGVGVLLLLGPIINKPLEFDDVIAAAKVDQVDWVARDVIVEYDVSRDATGRFSAAVSERYTADFRNGPEHSVNRVLVTEFAGHDAEFELDEVTVDGVQVAAQIARRTTTTTVQITRPDQSDFSGEHEIVVSYRLHNLVTSAIDDATGAPVDSWNWPVFGELWPQATKGIDVELTLPVELDAALIRPPQAHVGWLLASATQWLTPEEPAVDAAGTEPESGDTVRYHFSNDQGLPPFPDILIRTSFEPGTFAQPETTTLFWWQSYGPVLPLGALALLALFASAARRVVWADSAGEPWYLARSEPPQGLTPDLATALLGKSGHAELLSELAANPGPARSDERQFARLARAGRRAGRWGNFPAAWAAALRWRRTDEVVERGLRWVPDSYVRDFFVFAPVAITLLQWGLLRQLSQQVILSVVWWPAAFVLVSTVLAVTTLALVHRPRPLTRMGALSVQQLKGVHVFARATRLLERGPLSEPVLPYALLFVSSRRAGKHVERLAVDEARDRSIASGWRGTRFVSLSALLALAAAVAVLAGTIVVVATQAPPYEKTDHYSEEASNLPGTLYTETAGFDVRAELARGVDGTARLEVTERLTAVFAEDSARVPQYAREWPTQYLGQDLGFDLGPVTIDGTPMTVREIEQPRSRVMVTQFSQALSGRHEIELRYTLRSAAVAAPHSAGNLQQVPWIAWLETWDDEYYTNPSSPYDGSAPVRPLRLELTVAADLAAELRGGGWIDLDLDRPRVPGAVGNSVLPWQSESSWYDDTGQRRELRIGTERTRSDGALVVTFDADAVESRAVDVLGEGGSFEIEADVNAQLGKYELEVGAFTELGARIDFPAGTFPGVEKGAAERALAAYERPYVGLMWLTGVVLGVAIGITAAAALRRRAPSLGLKLVGFIGVPVLLVAQCVLFWWVIGPMAGSDTRGTGAFVLAGVTWAAVVAQCVVLARRLGAAGGE